MKVLRAKLAARHSIFAVTRAERGVGIEVMDVLYPIRLALMDVNFGTTAVPGLVLATRVIQVEGIWMSTGAAIPGDAAMTPAFRDRLEKMLPRGGSPDKLSPQRRSDLTAIIIRACLEAGGMAHVAHADPAAELPEPRRPGPARLGADDRRYLAPAKVGRNDPCPCGSGRKYKKCCGHGRA